MKVTKVWFFEESGEYLVQIKGKEYKRMEKYARMLGKLLAKDRNSDDKKARIRAELDVARQKEQTALIYLKICKEDIPEGAAVKKLHRKPENIASPSAGLWKRFMDELASAELSDELCEALEGEALVGTPLWNHYLKMHRKPQAKAVAVRYY